jgi:hypothetical protein
MKNQFYAVWPKDDLCTNDFNMEKTKLYLNDISELPGPGEERYFSSGFKGIRISYGDTCIHQEYHCTTGTAVQFGSRSKKNGTQLTPCNRHNGVYVDCDNGMSAAYGKRSRAYMHTKAAQQFN